MGAPQIIMIFVIIFKLLVWSLLDGEKIDHKVNFTFNFVCLILFQALLFWGGFWGGN